MPAPRQVSLLRDAIKVKFGIDVKVDNGMQERFAIDQMLNQIKQDGAAYEDSKAAYAQLAYRLGTVTPYVGVSRSFTQPELLPGGPLAALTASLVAQSHVDQHTASLGVRWDFQKNMALKAQLDQISGKPASLFLVKNPQPDWNGRMTVFSLTLDFVF